MSIFEKHSSTKREGENVKYENRKMKQFLKYFIARKF